MSYNHSTRTRTGIRFAGQPVRLVRRCFDRSGVEMQIVNGHDSESQCRPEHGDAAFVLPYRKYIKLSSVGGAILPLLTSQGGGVTLRWASSSNRIDVENSRKRRLSEPLPAIFGMPPERQEVL